jgi:beta-lactamase regulating signal transducer with metallopeptidase domain
MIGMKTEIHTLCAHVVSALLNGAYQGILVAALVSVVLRFAVRTNAATRYAVWFASLLLVVLIIPAHYWLDRERPAEGAMDDYDSSTRSKAEESQAVAPDFLDRVIDPFGQKDSMELATVEPVSPSGRDVIPAVLFQFPAESGKPPRQDVPFGPADEMASVAGFAGDLAKLWLTVLRRFLQPVSLSVESGLGLALVLALVSGSLVASVRLSWLVFRLWQLRVLERDSSLPKSDLQNLFQELRIAGGSTRRIALRISCHQQCPVVLGFIRPTILLPAEIATQPGLSEAREVLRHELAHVRRYDDWTNLAQHVVRAILFFHPAVWWIGERLSLEREIACDDYVLQQGGGRRNYALILTSVASRIRQGTPALAPGVSNSNSQLQQRISMILDTRRNSSPGLAKRPLAAILSAAGLVAALGFCAGPRLVLAGSPPVAAIGVTASSDPQPVPVPAAAPAGEPVPATPALPSTSADSSAPSVVAAGIDPGPKLKPENPDEPATSVAVSAPEAPEPPEPPDMGLGPKFRTPRAPRPQKPGKMPKLADSPEARNGDGSIEERLRRLEKMVHSLMEQQGPRRSRSTMYLKDGDNDQAVIVEQQKLEKLKQLADRQGDLGSEQRIQQLAERQAARAAEQAQRAADQAKRATKELEAMAEQDQQNKGDLHEGFQRQIEALRKARESLGQEMERLDRQIEKIEKEQQRSEKEPQRRRSEVGGAKVQASADVPEEAGQ